MLKERTILPNEIEEVCAGGPELDHFQVPDLNFLNPIYTKYSPALQSFLNAEGNKQKGLVYKIIFNRQQI